MVELELLLAYQDADLKIDACEAELKNSAAYKRFVKVRTYLADQKRVIARMTDSVDERRRQIGQTSANADLLEQKFEDARQKYEKIDKEDSGEIERFRKYYEQINQLLATQRREFSELVSSIESDDSQLSDLRNRLGKARKEYDELKAKTDEERQSKTGELETLAKKRDELAKGIPAPLLERYNTIKKSHSMPAAIVTDNRCSGCAMELPAVALRNLKEGDGIVECDNCGRILVYRPDGQ